MKWRKILQLSLMVMLTACENKETENDKTFSLKNWRPKFREYETVTSEMTGIQRLSLCYQEEESRSGGSKNRIFPPYLGGFYPSEEEPSKMIVLLTDTSEQVKNELINLCSLNPEEFVFKWCKYSLAEIYGLSYEITTIPDFFENWNVVALGCDMRKNRLEIQINRMRDEKFIESFKANVSDSPLIELSFIDDELPIDQPQESAQKAETNIKVESADPVYKASPGDPIYSPVRSGYRNKGSMGFLLDFTSEWIPNWPKGFVTAAHVVWEEGDELHFKNGNSYPLFGVADEIHRDKDLAICASYDGFAELTAWYDPTPCHPEIGDRVEVCGSTLGGYWSGVVTKQNIEVYISRLYQKVWCSEVTMDNNRKLGEGDSGGIVIMEDGNKVGGMLIAIHSGLLWKGYFVSALEITHEYGLKITK